MTLLVQPRLPGTLPSPKDVRRALSDTKVQLAQARASLEAMREARKVAGERLADAEDDRGDRLADLEDDNSPAAAARYVAAVEAMREREMELTGARMAVREAREATRKAEARRRAADEDMLAIAHGTRAGRPDA